MNSEPCVRFGIRINPKISENPDDSRNSSPPNVMLFTASTRYKVIAGLFSRRQLKKARAPVLAPAIAVSRSALFQRRIIPRIDRMREVLLLRPVPELADILVGLHRLIPELEAVFRALFAHLANVNVADDIAEMVELDRPARGVRQGDLFHHAHELFFVAGVTARSLETRRDDFAIDIEAGGIEARHGIEVLHHGIDKALVAVGREVERIGAGAHESDRFVAEALEQRIVAPSFAGHDRIFKAGSGILLHEAQRI